MAAEFESEQFSHSEFMALALNIISEIVKDPLLNDLHSEPSVEEVNSQIALEHGRAIVVNVVQQNKEKSVLGMLNCFTLFISDKSMERGMMSALY